MASAGLNLPRLPHHRTCGFPHPAVGDLLVQSSEVGWHPSDPLTSLSVRGPRAYKVSLPGSGSRRYCRRGQPGSRCVWRGVRYGQLTSGRVFPLRNVPYSFVWFLRPFAPSGFRRPSLLLRPLLTPPALSGRRSPRVSALTFLPCQPALLGAPSMDFWTSRFLARSSLAPGLAAGSCSFGREFASNFFQPRPHGRCLVVQLRLPPSVPISSFHLIS